MIKYSNLDRMKQPTRCPKCGQRVTVEETEFFHVEICEHCLDHTTIDPIAECCRKPDHIHVRMITAGGTIQVKKQCKNCGKAGGPAIGGFTQQQKASMPLLNEKLRDENEKERSEMRSSYWEKIVALRQGRYEKQRQQQRAAWLDQYNIYLKTPEWKAKRDMVLKRDKYLCQACLDAYATQVHHKSYEFVDLNGSEPCFDLVAICTPCHARIEEMKKQARQ